MFACETTVVTFLQFQVHLKSGKYSSLGGFFQNPSVRPASAEDESGPPRRRPRVTAVASAVSYFNADIPLN